MKLKLIHTCAILLLVVAFSGCAAFKQDTLSKPIEIDATANYKYGLHAIDEQGNVVKDADSFEFKDVNKGDSFSHNVDRTYQDTFKAKIAAYNAAAQIAAASAADGEFTEAEFTIAAMLFESASNEPLGQYILTENVDATRTNDAEALAQARIAQFESQATYKTERNKRLFDTVDKGIEVANPVGAAASNATSLLGDLIAARSAERRAQPDVEPVTDPVEAVE